MTVFFFFTVSHKGSISEYIWGFCVDSIKSNAKIKKEERSGKVGTVEKADLKSI